MRRFALSTLREYGMGRKTIEDKIVEECHFLREKFESFEGKPFDPNTMTSAVACNMVTSLVFGKQYDYEDPVFVRMLNLVKENDWALADPFVMIYNLFPFLGSFVGARKMLMSNKKEMRAFIQDTLREHLKELDENDKRSLVDSFLIQQQEEKKNKINGFSHNDSLAVLVSNLFCAGMSPVSTTLSWGLLLLTRYPEIQSQRMCAGKTLAKMELFLFFTSLLQRFTFQPAPGISPEDVDLTPTAGFSSRPPLFKLCALSRS